MTFLTTKQRLSSQPLRYFIDQILTKEFRRFNYGYIFIAPPSLSLSVSLNSSFARFELQIPRDVGGKLILKIMEWKIKFFLRKKCKNSHSERNGATVLNTFNLRY